MRSWGWGPHDGISGRWGVAGAKLVKVSVLGDVVKQVVGNRSQRALKAVVKTFIFTPRNDIVQF